MSDTPKGGLGTYVSQAWLILLLAIVFGCALAGVELALKDRIAQNKLEKTKREIPTFFASADVDKASQVEVTDENGKVLATVWKIVDKDEKTLGWILPGKGSGYADTIELIIAVDKDCEKVLGMSVLKQAETPALGDKITKPKFQSNFAKDKGLKAETISVVKGAAIANPEKNQIQAITGATISSQSVTNIVNKTIASFKPFIQEQGSK